MFGDIFNKKWELCLGWEDMLFLGKKNALSMIESAFKKKFYLAETVTDTGGVPSLTLIQHHYGHQLINSP